MNKKKNLLFSIKHACVGISLCCMVAGAEAAWIGETHAPADDEGKRDGANQVSAGNED